MTRCKNVFSKGEVIVTLRQRRYFDDTDRTRSQNPRSFSGIYRKFGVELLLVLALVLTLLFGGYATHPGLHVAGAAVLLNLTVWRRASQGTAVRIILLLLLDIAALITIMAGGDMFELWLSSFYGLATILLMILL